MAATVAAPGMFTADNLYGPHRSRQPSSTPRPEHSPGEPEPQARTEASPTRQVGGFLANPIVMLVLLTGAALAILNISISGGVGVEGGVNLGR